MTTEELSNRSGTKLWSNQSGLGYKIVSESLKIPPLNPSSQVERITNLPKTHINQRGKETKGNPEGAGKLHRGGCYIFS